VHGLLLTPSAAAASDGHRGLIGGMSSVERGSAFRGGHRIPLAIGVVEILRVGVAQRLVLSHCDQEADDVGLGVADAVVDPGCELAIRLPAALRQLDAALDAARTGDGGGWEI
jgi:hypothetical protein